MGFAIHQHESAVGVFLPFLNFLNVDEVCHLGKRCILSAWVGVCVVQLLCSAGNDLHTILNSTSGKSPIPTSALFSSLCIPSFWRRSVYLSYPLFPVWACMRACMLSRFGCVWLCNPMDCSPPGSSVHGISQARVREWCCHALLQGIFQTQGSNQQLLSLLHWQVGSFPRGLPGEPSVFRRGC